MGGQESEVHAVGIGGVVHTGRSRDSAGDIHVDRTEVVGAGAADEDQLPLRRWRRVAALGDLVRGVAATHGIAEGAEVVECQGLCGLARHSGDKAGLVVGGDMAIQGRGQGACPVVEADQFLEGGRVGVHEDRVCQGIRRVLAVLRGPTEDGGAVSQGGYCSNSTRETEWTL